MEEIIKKAIEIAERTGEFVIDQAPDLLREFYAWRIASNIMIVLFFIIFSYIYYRIFKSLGVKEDDGYSDFKLFGLNYDFDDPLFIFVVIFGGVFSITGLVFFCNSIYELIQILVAPKIYIIEYFLKK